LALPSSSAGVPAFGKAKVTGESETWTSRPVDARLRQQFRTALGAT
jgi:hypothetical protein